MIKPLDLAVATALSLLSSLAAAEVVRVQVTGLAANSGQIGCTLHTPSSDFPMGQSGAQQIWVRPSQQSAICTFNDVVPGSYAVAIAHDMNGNRIVDTNALGLPQEAWGVSRNVRPRLRAPRFNEASFAVTKAGVSLQIEVK